ncbi:MAG: H-type small acid-soluble spore protein [Bacillota bacterium]|nr:H-type small acid-soluble spore protein [Bacillota bacterium]
MDAQRAQEITNSPIMVNVTYNGSPVYIEHVDREKQIATVLSPLTNSDGGILTDNGVAA